MESYDHKKIEKKWREIWKKSGIYATQDSVKGKENFYLLVEFPYPSGNLHVGHWYAFAVPDILARYQRMRGKNVLFPIGFDAFGLPAENAAIKNKLNPRVWTQKNIDYMSQQIESMGTSFDWSRKVSTIDPEYYKWTQWMFLQFFQKGLVYQKNTAVNWCPKDKTVLANEQVVDGKCERCDSPVEQKMMLQWNIMITKYADRLIDDLEKLDWPEEIKMSQRNWIGRSEGAEIDFPLDLGKKLKYVILHGYGGKADAPRWNWIKGELEKMGHEVIIPQLPNAEHPREAEQVEAALGAAEYDKNTVLMGHSLGSVVAMKVLEKLKKPIGRLVLVGGFCDPNFKDKPRDFEKYFQWKFDAEKIKKNAPVIQLLHDPHDHAISDEQVSRLEKLLGISAVRGNSNAPHFTGDTEPDVLMWLRATIRVFTTRPDTLFGATYLVLSPEHPWLKLALSHRGLFSNEKEIAAYIEKASHKTELERMTDQKEKTGVKIEGLSALNPATGEKIPVYVADYVLATYGTGAIMAVPAHDERDHAFAKKFKLPVRRVVEPKYVNTVGDSAVKEGEEFIPRNAVCVIVRDPKNDNYLCISWKGMHMNGLVTGGLEEGEDIVAAARREVEEETGYKNLKLIRSDDCAIHSLFYHRQKKQNRHARFQYVFFELENDRREPIDEKEAALMDVVWIKKSKLKDFFSVVEGEFVTRLIDNADYIHTGEGIMANSGQFTGMESSEAKHEITEKFGRKKTTYKLRDWIVSRQRYWGVPIPIVHCEQCGAQPVKDADLPVLLPDVEDYLPTGDGKSPLAKVGAFMQTKCPHCNAPGKRETDTLDTFVDSSWYFLRYCDPGNIREFAARNKMDAWLPIDLYSGGAEHTTMHLLYSRFWHKALYDLGLVADQEPYARRMNRSLIMGPDGQKMSKSRGNVIDPDEVVERLGADTVRMYLAFIGPYNEVSSYPWNPDGVVGVRRFLERVWRLQESVQKEDVKELNATLHKTIKKVGEDIAVQKYNTAISQLMIALNEIEKRKGIGERQWEMFLKLIEPFAPHLADELWERSGHRKPLLGEDWPVYSDEFLKEEVMTIAIQVNGKTRASIEIASNASKEEIERAAHEAIASRILGKKIEKTIFVPNRLVNFVLEA